MKPALHNKLQKSTQGSVLETAKGNIEVTNDSPKKETAQINEIIQVKLPAKAIPEYKLPSLTQKAQDAYYGKGCKINFYRKRLQVVFYEWQRLAKRRNIAYFICYGSLLGAVRNNDIVPYDSDVDVTIFRHDYHKLYPEESQRPLDLNDGSIHMLLQRHSPHPKNDTPRRDCKGNIVRKVVDDCSIMDPQGRLYNGVFVYIDIFVIEDLGDKLWDEYSDEFHDRHTIFPLRPCTFLGFDTKCPNNAQKYWWAYYEKNYMKPHWVCKKGKWMKNMRSARERLLP